MEISKFTEDDEPETTEKKVCPFKNINKISMN